MFQTENSKLAFKHWSTIVILAIIAGFVGWFLLNLGPVLQYFNEKYADYKVRQMIEKMQEPYKNDTIGGVIPEETFDMFIAALKDDDIELASKYFVIKRQNNWLKTLREYRNNRLLSDFILELEDKKNTWKKNASGNSNIIEFYSTVTLEEDGFIEYKGEKFPIEGGDYTNTTRFEKYPSGIWKINLL